RHPARRPRQQRRLRRLRPLRRNAARARARIDSGQRGGADRADQARAAGDDRTRQRAHPERRLDRRLPARAADGGLLRDQGLRDLVQRGDLERAGGHRGDGDGALPRSDGDGIPGGGPSGVVADRVAAPEGDVALGRRGGVRGDDGGEGRRDPGGVEQDFSARAAAAQTPDGQPKALVFDVFGTVVDWRTSVAAEVKALAARKKLTVDGEKFADAWRAGYGPSMNRVRSGELPWTRLDSLHRLTLDRILDEFKIAGLDDAEK